MHRISVVDTHTGGEPTRVVVGGGPDLGGGSLAERRARFVAEFDHFRSAIVNEPRGSDVMVGALLVPPDDPQCQVGVIYFNNVGVIGMCGHGTMGVAVALGHLGRLPRGQHRFATPVGSIVVEYDGRNRVALENVPAYRFRSGVAVDVPGYGAVVGDIAWGGNWFFLVEMPDQELHVRRAAELTDLATRIRRALAAQQITGEQGAEIDHVELCGPPRAAAHHGRNFVLCPGLAYDRSPCGTGTSAKLACLAADGKLVEGAVWRQESIVGSVFEASYRREGERLIPRLVGTAYVTGEATLLVDENDPFAWGIRGDGTAIGRGE
jgi:4-hydroxyproline epimerase